jgi:hypothetical protein
LQYIDDHSHYLDQLVGLKWVQLINATSGTPSKIDENGRRHYLIRAIPYQDPEMDAARPKKVHQARVKIVPRV